jgi:hypothetical protein
MDARDPNTHIFQIFYSKETRSMLDPGFEPLDNSKNERPDWREYWPIRNFLRANRLIPGDYYGFLSPAFGRKTGLTSATVREFAKLHGGAADVLLFSPFYDQIAFFLNQWEQGALTHRGATVFERSLELVAPEFKIYRTVSSSRDSVFCNYFLAKAEFWLEWFARCERIFERAEQRRCELSAALNQSVHYGPQAAPAKVFILERVVSALLATQTHWTVKAYNPMLLPLSGSTISALQLELCALDALKIAYQTDPREQYLETFFQLRARFAAMPPKR